MTQGVNGKGRAGICGMRAYIGTGKRYRQHRVYIGINEQSWERGYRSVVRGTDVSSVICRRNARILRAPRLVSSYE